MDDEGFVYIVDRKKEMIVSGGENIYPREIEEVIIRHPSVADVAVIGVPHPTWGETVKAFVVPMQSQAIDEKEVINFCKKYLASYKKPTVVDFVPEIPRNPSGKALKLSGITYRHPLYYPFGYGCFPFHCLHLLKYRRPVHHPVDEKNGFTPLLLAMVVSIILGMGITTTAAYLWLNVHREKIQRIAA